MLAAKLACSVLSPVAPPASISNGNTIANNGAVTTVLMSRSMIEPEKRTLLLAAKAGLSSVMSGGASKSCHEQVLSSGHKIQGLGSVPENVTLIDHRMTNGIYAFGFASGLEICRVFWPPIILKDDFNLATSVRKSFFNRTVFRTRLGNEHYQLRTNLHNGSARGDPLEDAQPEALIQKLAINSSERSNNGIITSPDSVSICSTGRLTSHSLNVQYPNGVPDKSAIVEEVRGSSLSLASTSSSVYSGAVEEKYQSEIRKLHREVEVYREKVQTLTTQQTTYAHVVAAFEQSLKSMDKRVQSLTAVSEQKKHCEKNGL
uniref:Uncharacterized protein n=1 Tax=Romanomermis culicivorax TaxID=13658 RepID=A0A915J0J0_ROMCU